VTADLSTEQQMPVPNDSPSVQGMVRADLVTREQIGIQRYGTALQPYNGRDMLRDAYEEVLDLACYLRGAIAERPREDVDAAVAAVRAELEPEIRRKDDLLAEMRRQLKAADDIRNRYVADHRRVPRLEGILRYAQEALAEAPRECRFHGTDFERSGRQHGVPRCDSCRQPWLVTVASMNITAELGS
jgi:hypothetical protein